MPYDGDGGCNEQTETQAGGGVGPQPFSFDDILRYVDPAPDDETERFVEAIYADRRQSAERPHLNS